MRITHALSQKARDEFRAAYEAEFEEKLTEEQIAKLAIDLFTLFDMLDKVTQSAHN